MQDDLIAVSDAARILGLGDQRVQQLADSGVLPCERTARGWRLFRRSAVERLKKDREKRQREKKKTEAA